jgi:hypothetical protein
MAETVRVESADIGQRLAPDIHAEADGRGGCHETAGIDGPAVGIDVLDAPAERKGATGVVRIAADRRVVRQGRDAGDAQPRIGLGRQPVQPAWRDLGIAVQQDDVTRAGRLHAGIHRADKAEIAPVPDQSDASGRGKPIQPGDQFRVRRLVVDDDDIAEHGVFACQH